MAGIGMGLVVLTTLLWYYIQGTKDALEDRKLGWSIWFLAGSTAIAAAIVAILYLMSLTD